MNDRTHLSLSDSTFEIVALAQSLRGAMRRGDWSVVADVVSALEKGAPEGNLYYVLSDATNVEEEERERGERTRFSRSRTGSAAGDIGRTSRPWPR